MAASNIRKSPININIYNLQKTLRLNANAFERLVKEILRLKHVSKGDLSVSFVSRQRIQALNKKFLGRTYATDVLAFNLSDDQKILVGDIIISTDAAIKYSKTNRVTLVDEIALYVVHGILHLLGYDDHSPKDIARMREEESRIMKRIRKNFVHVIASEAKQSQNY